MNSIHRLPDWSIKLRDFVAAEKQKPYTIPANDCVHFCARAIEAMTGSVIDLSKFAYTNEQEMIELKNKLGGLKQAVEIVLEQSALGPLCARRGDLVYFHPAGDLEALGICMGTNFVVVGDTGIVVFPLERAEASWRVG